MSLGLLSVPTTRRTRRPVRRNDARMGPAPFTVGSYANGSKTVLERRGRVRLGADRGQSPGGGLPRHITYEVVPGPACARGSMQSQKIDANDRHRNRRTCRSSTATGSGPSVARTRASRTTSSPTSRARSSPTRGSAQAFSKAVDRTTLARILNPGDVAVTSALSVSTPRLPTTPPTSRSTWRGQPVARRGRLGQGRGRDPGQGRQGAHRHRDVLAAHDRRAGARPAAGTRSRHRPAAQAGHHRRDHGPAETPATTTSCSTT